MGASLRNPLRKPTGADLRAMILSVADTDCSCAVERRTSHRMHWSTRR